MASVERDAGETLCEETVCVAGETLCEETVCVAGETLCEETSPDSKCPICLERFRNVSYADRCFHRFCFRCILEWGKNKAECPLCKQPFTSIYHSVRSEDDFRLYQLRPSHRASFGYVRGQRFRYRSTLTRQHRREGSARETSNRQEVMRFRRRLYCRGARVLHVRDSGRSRDTSAEFFRKNPACLHRLVPWLKRELAVIYGSHDSVADVVLHVILSLITRHDIHGEAFLRELRPFLSSRTEHFLHEFLSFAKAPFNMEAYDLHAEYDCPAPSHLSAVSEDDADLSSAPSPWDDETPGPSYSSTTGNVVTVSDSEADNAMEENEEESERVDANVNISSAQAEGEEHHSSDEDCVIVGFIKPVTQRTPELVQLSSDSDTSEPSASNQSQPRDLTNQRSRNTGNISSHSAPEHSPRVYSSHDHRRRSHRNRDTRRSKATNHSSASYRHKHTHRYTHTNSSRHTQRLRARSGARSRARSGARSRARSGARSRARSRSRSRARSGSRSRARSGARSRARSRSRSRARSRSRSRARSGSRSRARSRSRSRARSGSGSRARSGARSRARSRSRSRARSGARSRARSGARSRARSRSRTCGGFYTEHCPSSSSRRNFSHNKADRKQKDDSVHEEERSSEKHLHSKKKMKKKKSGRRSSSLEFGAENHHKRKKKHKKKRQSERRGRSSGTHLSADIAILTDIQSVEEATPPRCATATSTENTHTH